MVTTRIAALAGGVFALLAAPVVAQDSRFTWEGEIELGNESVLSSNGAGNKISNTYLAINLDGEWLISDTVLMFGGVTLESLSDPASSRAFKDMGAYIRVLGLQFAVGEKVTISVGKLDPSFGTIWDTSAGFYGAGFAEDYQLSEMLGGIVDVDLGGAGGLSFSLFFVDNTFLSKSVGYKVGQNTTAAGGAGNTGRLDNVSLEWKKNWGDSTYALVGIRHLSAGFGDVSDETGLVAGVGYGLETGLNLVGEIATFDGFGGSSDTATYVTLNANYAIGDLTLSGTYSQAQITSVGKSKMASIAVDYEFNDQISLGAGLARVDSAGDKDTILGVNLVFTFGNT